MKLHIRRNQADAKGILGGHKGVMFTTDARIVLEDDEPEMVRRCKLESYSSQVELRPPRANTSHYTFGQLIAGISQGSKNVANLVEFEVQLQGSCRVLKAWIDVARTFGGEVVWDPDSGEVVSPEVISPV